MQAGTYLLTYQRYIEFNPVRAAIVDDPAHDRWTSYRANALGQADTRLTSHSLHSLYRALGHGDHDCDYDYDYDRVRQVAYRALLLAHLDLAAIDHIRLGTQSMPAVRQRPLLNEDSKHDWVRRDARPRGDQEMKRPIAMKLKGKERRRCEYCKPGPFILFTQKLTRSANCLNSVVHAYLGMYFICCLSNATLTLRHH